MFNYKVGQFLREQSREKLQRDPGYGVNRGDKVQTRSMSYLEKTMAKVGRHSYISQEDLIDESPLASASMTMTTICAGDLETQQEGTADSPSTLPDSLNAITPKVMEPQSSLKKTQRS